MDNEKVIGIVGGAGPFAGLDLLTKTLEQTAAGKDQDHLTIASLSKPNRISDRTEYLLGKTAVNPAYEIADQLLLLEKIGAQVAGIPCNTAHAPPIFNVILDQLKTVGSQIKFLNMIAEVARFLEENHPKIKRVGILSTTGTNKSRVYSIILEPAEFEVIFPEQDLQELVIHQAIYHPEYGIKACGRATEQAKENLRIGCRFLQEAGAEAVILGCTEIPLAIREKRLGQMLVIDPTLILARALIREANPAKLKPYPAR